MPDTNNNGLSVMGAIEERRREVALRCAVDSHRAYAPDTVLSVALRYEQYLKTGETNAG